MFEMFQDEEDEDDEEQKVPSEKPSVLDTNNSFCWGCGEKWVDGHICDSSFRRDLCEILQNAEVKKIGQVEGVPSIRCCPNCCQLLYHIDCCKHMRCGQCKKYFCFVCMKPQKEGRWQCGSSSTVCPVAERQNLDSFLDNIVITKAQFRFFDDQENRKK